MKTNELPQADYLREILEYMDGALIAKKRPLHHFSNERQWKIWNARFAGKQVGRKMPGGNYRQAMIDNVRYLEHRIIAAMFGLDTSGVIDHVDGNGLNNRIENLRSASQQENCHNNSGWTKKPLRVGVSAKRDGKFIAYIRVAGKIKHLGTFAVESEAVNARLIAEQEWYGIFAVSNSRSCF